MRQRNSTLSRRRFLQLGGGLVGGGVLAGCGEPAAGGARFPTRPVEILIAYAAGGGTDTGARILQPYLEEALGQSVNIVNRPGGSGWVAWEELAQARPDGHMIGMINSPNLISGYLNPELNIDHDLSSFTPIANQVTDYGAIAVNAADNRFPDIDALIKQAKTNRLTATSTGVASDDHFSALALNDGFDTRFEPVHFDGSAEGVTAVLGRNVDVMFANVGEVFSLHNDGRVRALAVMSDATERSEFLPDVPTLAEAGYPDVFSWSSRGFAGPAGMDPQALRTLGDALRTAVQNPEHVEQLGKQGLQADYLAGKEYQQLLEKGEQRVERLGGQYVW